MHMPKLKRLALIFSVIFALFLVPVVSVVYFFNVNDDSDWITKQVKRATGYDIRFETFENRWFAESQISIMGLALYQQQQRVWLIDKLELKINKLDLWKRQLEVQSLSLQGVKVDIQTPFTPLTGHIDSRGEAQKQIYDLQNIGWESLDIVKFEIIDLNALVKKEGKKLLLKEANIELNDLSVIKQNKLQILPTKLGLIAKLKTLQFSDEKQKIAVSNLKLSSHANLAMQEGKLNLSADEINIERETQNALLLQSLDLQLHLAQNKLSIPHFFVNVFSGSLALQADAYLSVSLLPAPVIRLGKVDLHSLLAKNMKINVPKLSFEPTKTSKNKALPIEVLFIESVDLQNIDIRSELENLPLTLTSLDARLTDFYLIKEGQLVDPIQTKQQSGNFSLAFSYLRWKDSIMEQLSIEGSLTEDDQGVRLLKQLEEK